MVFEICAAPFGTGFFVSSRLFNRRCDAKPSDYYFTLGAIGLFGFGLFLVFGWVLGIVIIGTILTTLWSLMRLGAFADIAWVDEKLSMIPWLGPIYETWFHPDTFFRQDLSSMYRQTVDNAMEDAIREMTKAPGVTRLSDAEALPRLGELERGTASKEERIKE